MKRILTILFFFIGGFVTAQQKPQQFVSGLNVQGVARDQFRIDSLLYMPLTDTIKSPGRAGVVIIKQSDNRMYLYDGTFWRQMTNSLDLLLYLKKTDTIGKWMPLGSGWKVTGNAGTVDGVNFIGTTDNVALTFKVNNQASGRIDRTNQNSFFGYQAGISSTGINNTAVGFSALRGNISGTANVAIGSGALLNNSLGSQNIALGFNSMFSNSTGIANMAIGQQVLVNNTSGSDNIGIGNQALFNVTTGVANTAIGHLSANGIATGSYNTILGANVSGLDPGLNNNIIIADGQGNQRFTVDSFGTVVLHSTTALGLPTGNTAQRPPSPLVGYTRYNTDSTGKETFNGSIWVKDGTGGGGGSGITALTGDVTATGPGSVPAIIGAHKVTYGKIQAATGQALLGAPGVGDYQEITLGTNLSITSGVLNASGGSTPGGANTQVQFNDAGAFAGNSGFTYDKTAHKFSSDSGFLFKLNLNTISSLKGHLYGFGNSIMFGVNVPDSTFAFGTIAALQMGMVPILNGVSSSTLEHQTPFQPFGAQDMIQRIPLIPFTSNKNDRLVFELGLNDARSMLANYNRANYGTDFQTVLDSCFARGWAADQITIIAPPYMSPTSYTSLLGNPPLTQAIHLQWVATSDSIAIANGCRWFDAYHYMQNNGGNFLESNDSIHPNIRGQQILATGLVATMRAPVVINSNVANVNGTLEAVRLKIRGLDTLPANTFFTPMALSSNGDVVAAPNAFIYSNFTNLANYGAVNITGRIVAGNADATQPQNLLVKGGGQVDAFTVTGAVPGTLSHTKGVEIFGNLNSTTGYIGAVDRTSGTTPMNLDINGVGASVYFGGLGAAVGNSGETVQVTGSEFLTADLHAGHDLLVGHAIATGIAIASPATTADFAGYLGTSTGRVQGYVDATFFTSSDAVWMVKGNAGNYSGFSLSENGIADRWSMFIKPSDQNLYFGTNSSAPSLTTVRATLTAKGALLLNDSISFKSARTGTSTDSVQVHDAVTGATKLVAQNSIGGSNNYSIATAPNTANYTVSGNNFIILSDLTGQANRIVTLPSSPVSGQPLVLVNQNGGSGFTWSTNTAITLSDGSTITTLDNSKTYTIVWDGSSKWYVIN